MNGRPAEGVARRSDVNHPTRLKGTRDFSSGYKRSHRLYETGGIVAAIACACALAVRVTISGNLSGWFVPLALFVGILGADLTSGLVHWGCDTWGNTSTPILGQLAIRAFREHHIDPKSITRHDFVETNGHNFALSVLPSTIGFFLAGQRTLTCALTSMCLLAMAIFVAMTSQIHKWAHTKTPPRLVRFLQDVRIIISTPHHEKHHARPYNRNFCITVGWLNGPLRAIRFFETSERLICAFTNAIPRQDDIGATKTEIDPGGDAPAEHPDLSSSRAVK